VLVEATFLDEEEEPVVDGIPTSYLSKARLVLNDESNNLLLSKSFKSLSAVEVAPALCTVPSAEGYPDPTNPVDPAL